LNRGREEKGGEGARPFPAFVCFSRAPKKAGRKKRRRPDARHGQVGIFPLFLPFPFGVLRRRQVKKGERGREREKKKRERKKVAPVRRLSSPMERVGKVKKKKKKKAHIPN